MLNRIPKIKDQYQGKSLLRTYFSVIIRNICNELIRKRGKTEFTSLDVVNHKQSSDEVMNFILIQEEISKLKTTINLYNEQKSKLILCLKLKFRMPFDFQDFHNTFQKITIADFELFRQKIHPYQENPDIIILSLLTDIFNKFEEKSNSPDALRKWLKLKIIELVAILNGSPPVSMYNEETLQFLFEKSYYNEHGIPEKRLTRNVSQI